MTYSLFEMRVYICQNSLKVVIIAIYQQIGIRKLVNLSVDLPATRQKMTYKF